MYEYYCERLSVGDEMQIRRFGTDAYTDAGVKEKQHQHQLIKRNRTDFLKWNFQTCENGF